MGSQDLAFLDAGFDGESELEENSDEEESYDEDSDGMGKRGELDEGVYGQVSFFDEPETKLSGKKKKRKKKKPKKSAEGDGDEQPSKKRRKQNGDDDEDDEDKEEEDDDARTHADEEEKHQVWPVCLLLISSQVLIRNTEFKT